MLSHGSNRDLAILAPVWLAALALAAPFDLDASLALAGRAPALAELVRHFGEWPGWVAALLALIALGVGAERLRAVAIDEGEPCECCPQDLAFAPDGRAVLGYRNNIDNVRDMYVAISDQVGAFPEESVEVSDNDCNLMYCPVQGPRLVVDENRIPLAWAAAAEGAEAVQQSPTIASGGSGRVWVN